MFKISTKDSFSSPLNKLGYIYNINGVEKNDYRTRVSQIFVKEKGNCPVVEKMHFQELFIGDFCHDPLSLSDIDDIADAFYKIF